MGAKTLFYNHSFKEEFLRTKKFSNPFFTLFVRTKPHEERYGKDLAIWERNQIIGFIEDQNILSSQSVKSSISLLNSYLSWARSKTEFEPIRSTEIDLSKNYKKYGFASPLDLQQHLNRLFDPLPHKSHDVLWRSLIWLCYMGIPKDDILSLDLKDVHILKKRIDVGDISYSIPDEAVLTIRTLFRLTYFMRYKPFNIDQIPRDTGTKFLRLSQEDNKDIDLFAELSSTIVERNKERGETFTPKSIRRSGTFYRLYQLEKIGVVPNYLQAYQEITQDEPSASMPKKSWYRLNMVRYEYEAWKLAFYPPLVDEFKPSDFTDAPEGTEMVWLHWKDNIWQCDKCGFTYHTPDSRPPADFEINGCPKCLLKSIGTREIFSNSNPET